MNGFLHIDWNVKRVEKVVFLFCLLFLGYGYYKNGLSYVFLQKMNFLDTLVFLLIPFIGVLCSVIFDKWRGNALSLSTLSRGLMLGLLAPPRFPVFLFLGYTILFFVFFFLGSKFLKKLNLFSSFKVGLLLLTSLFSIGLQNVVEKNSGYVYGTIDTFFGRGFGGYGTTNLFLLLLLFLFLCSTFYYKKEIALWYLGTYTLLFFLLYFLFPSSYTLVDYLNPSVFFGGILFLPQCATSPVYPKFKILYALISALFSFLFLFFFHINEGGYFAIFLCNVFYAVVVFLRQKKTK